MALLIGIVELLEILTFCYPVIFIIAIIGLANVYTYALCVHATSRSLHVPIISGIIALISADYLQFIGHFSTGFNSQFTNGISVTARSRIVSHLFFSSPYISIKCLNMPRNNEGLGGVSLAESATHVRMACSRPPCVTLFSMLSLTCNSFNKPIGEKCI